MTLMGAAFAALTCRNVAHADERRRARLTYAPDAEIERCPSEREVKDAVAARLGYDPFVDAQAEDGEIVVKVRRRGTGIVGSLELRSPRSGQRELASPHGDCREVLDTFAVAIAIGIDPRSLSRRPGEAPPPPPAPPAPPVISPAQAAPPPAHEAPPAPEATPIDLHLGAGPLVMFGELPATAPALSVTFGARFRWFEPSLEGLASLPVSLGAKDGKITASLLALAFVPCGHADVFFGCVGITLGTLRGEGEGVAAPMHGSQVYASASARAGAELALSHTVWIRGYAEVVAPLTAITLQLAAQDVWTMPSVAARVGATVGVRF
jgi:hypothetical protein